MSLRDIFRIFHPKGMEYTLFLAVPGTFSFQAKKQVLTNAKNKIMLSNK
jgi:hypothetical protein